MPTYEFKCKFCEGTLDVTRSIRDDDPVMCDYCEEEMDRLIPSVTTFTLKGSSWAKDGYR